MTAFFKYQSDIQNKTTSVGWWDLYMSMLYALTHGPNRVISCFMPSMLEGSNI